MFGQDRSCELIGQVMPGYFMLGQVSSVISGYVTLGQV
jgi:hypothetical protein